MGYNKEHAIIVTSWNRELLEKAHKKAIKICDKLVCPVGTIQTNCISSFLIAPDGSKEGWDTSMQYDTKREEFIEWIHEQAYNDGSNSLRYVYISFAEDNGKTLIVDYN